MLWAVPHVTLESSRRHCTIKNHKIRKNQLRFTQRGGTLDWSEVGGGWLPYGGWGIFSKVKPNTRSQDIV